MTKTGWFALGFTAVLTAIGATIYIKNKKKKNESAEEENSEYQNSTTPKFWTGISEAQTKMLQQKLNELYSGSLSGFGASLVDFLKEGAQKMYNTFVSPALTAPKNGVAEFHAAIQTIMPLQVDGKYGMNTTEAVRALQMYLNANGANLTVDGKYGKNTDAATGWGIVGK